MNNVKIGKLLSQLLPAIEGGGGRWSGILMGGFRFYCLTDQTADRMRFIVPVLRVSPDDANLVYRCLEANFDTALDAKYAVRDGVLWSTFVHPLSPLTEGQVKDAFRQVVMLAENTGTSFSSGSLMFVGQVSANFRDEDDTRKRLPPELVRGKARETIQDDGPAPPDAFVCPIMLDIMQEPVTTPSGHSFERRAIERHILTFHNDPFTQKPLRRDEIRPNRALKEAIAQWRQEQEDKAKEAAMNAKNKA